MDGENFGRGANVEAMPDAEQLKRMQEVGSTAIEAMNAEEMPEQSSNVINLAENPRWQQYMAGQQAGEESGFQAPAVVENEMQVPAAVAEAEVQVPAEVAGFQAPVVAEEQVAEVDEASEGGVSELEKVLNGRSLEKALEDLEHDRDSWRAEIEEIKAEAGELTDAQRAQIAHDEAMIAETERKIAMVQQALEEMKPVKEAEDLIERAASGELDLNSPDNKTEAAMRRARFEAVYDDVRKIDIELAARLMTILADIEVKEEAEAKRQAEDFETSDYEEDPNIIDSVGRWVDELPDDSANEANALPGEVALSSEQREQVTTNIREKLKGRKGWKRTLGRVATVAVMAILTGASLYASISSNAVSRAKSGVRQAGVEREYSDGESSDSQASSEAREADNADNKLDLDALMAERGNVDLERHDIEALGDQVLEVFLDKGEGLQKNEFGVSMSYSDNYGSSDKESRNAFGKDFSYINHMEEGREKEALTQILTIEANQPETLASHVADLPNVMRAAGISDDIIGIKDYNERQKAVDALFNQEGGDALQKKLLGAMAVVLGGGDYDFYLENGVERTSYIYHANGEENTAENLVLGTDTRTRDNTEQIQIVVTYADGTQEMIDLNGPCGFQPNHNPDGSPRNATTINYDDPEKTPKPESTPTPTPEESATPTPEPSQTPDVTPGPTPGPEESATPTPEPSQMPGVTPTPIVTPTPSPVPGVTPTPGPTETPPVATKNPENLINTEEQGREDAGLGNIGRDPSASGVRDEDISEAPEVDKNVTTGMSDKEFADYMESILNGN